VHAEVLVSAVCLIHFHEPVSSGLVCCFALVLVDLVEKPGPKKRRDYPALGILVVRLDRRDERATPPLVEPLLHIGFVSVRRRGKSLGGHRDRVDGRPAQRRPGLGRIDGIEQLVYEEVLEVFVPEFLQAIFFCVFWQIHVVEGGLQLVRRHVL